MKRRGAGGEPSCSPVFAAQWMRTRVHDSHVTMTRGKRRKKRQRAEDSWVNRWKCLGPCWLGWAAQLTQGLFNLWIKDPSGLSHWSSSSLLFPDKINQTGRVWRVCNKKEFKFYSQGVGLGNWEEGASYWDKITTQTMCVWAPTGACRREGWVEKGGGAWGQERRKGKMFVPGHADLKILWNHLG